MRFLVTVRKAGDNYSASSPDVPGCYAVGDTYEEALESFRDALEFHVRGLREIGGEMPVATAMGDYVTIDIGSDEPGSSSKIAS